MALDLNQIQLSLDKRTKKNLITRASYLQRRLRFHTEPSVSMVDIGLPVTQFLDWVGTLLPLDKFNVFKQLFKLPVPTVSLVESIYNDLERVFYSRNSSASYQFVNSRYLEDWLSYRKNRLHEPEVWKTVGWSKMKVCHNSVLVVDLPALQTSDYPEPYFYWLDIENVIDYDLDELGGFNWLVFSQGDNKIAVFDKVSIGVYAVKKGIVQSSPISYNEHNLGFCTARFFWHSFINEQNKELKNNPLVKELSNLDWLLFFELSKRHLDTYAAYPIYSAYEAECDFENNETGEYCDGGFLRDVNGNYKVRVDGTLEPCPCCSQRRIAGAGSFVEVPVPNKDDGVPDMRSPIQITTIDRESLDYNVDEVKRLREQIRVSVVGSGGTVQDREAINETQVAANFESKTAVLNSLKTNFEEAQSFIDDTICRLRYGDSYVSCSVSWGTEFYIFTIEELYDKYKKAKETGASVSELDAILQQIIEVEYKNNPTMLQRMLLLKQLEPYPHRTLDELIRLKDSELADKDKLTVKLNFSNYVDKFERDNIDIVAFAANIPLRQKIKIINDKLLEYAKADNQRKQLGEEPDGSQA